MDDAEPEEKPTAKPYLTRLRLALGPYSVHFTNPGYVKDETLRMLDVNICKKTLEETRRNFELRFAPRLVRQICMILIARIVRNSDSPMNSGTTSPVL